MRLSLRVQMKSGVQNTDLPDAFFHPLGIHESWE